jgi:predicted nucleotide-binding protein (sugar kinase/HSP70/actin superfamily)
VESKEALTALNAKRKELKARYPNLVDYESKLAFRSFFAPDPIPAAGTTIDDFEVRRTMLGAIKRLPVRRPIRRSSSADAEYRARVRIGIPRVLNLYSTGPLWRTYFETLGVPAENVVFSDHTTEEMWAEGGKYGSIDPCYPSKVAQAHIHNLLFHKHRRARLDYIFFPCITHLPTYVEGVMDSTSCPIVAGAPKVMRSAFTKEVDFFAREGVEYVDPAATLAEPNYFAKQMHEVWGSRLRVTEDESDFACRQGFAALRQFDFEMERRGREILENLEARNEVGLLLLGRPYHNDPGLNHDVLEEFQALGYPILSMRSIPKDPDWLRRFFTDDLARGFVESPLQVTDVWPENYSTNSVQKVWAAKFAARHPNVVVLDLSSFKCGHDAPTYGLIDNIISTSATPYAALHDIDANKPGGSIKIRVKTYAHSLRLHVERLEELAAKRSELEKRVAAKRAELLALRAKQEREALHFRPEARKRFAEMEAAYESYLDEEALPKVFSDCQMPVVPETGASPLVQIQV